MLGLQSVLCFCYFLFPRARVGCARRFMNFQNLGRYFFDPKLFAIYITHLLAPIIPRRVSFVFVEVFFFFSESFPILYSNQTRHLPYFQSTMCIRSETTG